MLVLWLKNRLSEQMEEMENRRASSDNDVAPKITTLSNAALPISKETMGADGRNEEKEQHQVSMDRRATPKIITKTITGTTLLKQTMVAGKGN